MEEEEKEEIAKEKEKDRSRLRIRAMDSYLAIKYYKKKVVVTSHSSFAVSPQQWTHVFILPLPCAAYSECLIFDISHFMFHV